MTDASSANTGSALAACTTAVLDDLRARPLPAGLYVVATPIGNLADITLRALSVLARADLIACEDTRHTKKLVSHFGIRTPLTAYHEHNAERVRPKLLARIAEGAVIALVSDAGTPLISDPGHKLVREALEKGCPVSSLPGPSAALAALTSAGLATDTFHFEGFLPAKQAARRKRLETMSTIAATLVIYEAPNRLLAAIEDMAEILGDREGVVAKELTKLHERVVRARLSELGSHFSDPTMLKGEFVLVVAPPSPQEISDDEIRDRVRQIIDTMSARDAVRQITRELGVARNRVYKIALDLSNGNQ